MPTNKEWREKFRVLMGTPGLSVHFKKRIEETIICKRTDEEWEWLLLMTEREVLEQQKKKWLKDPEKYRVELEHLGIYPEEK